MWHAQTSLCATEERESGSRARPHTPPATARQPRLPRRAATERRRASCSLISQTSPNYSSAASHDSTDRSGFFFSLAAPRKVDGHKLLRRPLQAN